jgi:SAM-dependent methyltransferase
MGNPEVLFYGRRGPQALAMFNLDPRRWRGARVLDCAAGPGTLSSLLRASGVDVTAVDPLYSQADQELETRALNDLEATLARLANSQIVPPGFDPAACRNEHLQTLATFLDDRRAHPGSYVPGSLPQLPFPDQSFDLVLCGHLLFSYAPRSAGGLLEEPGLDLGWHRSAWLELMRVSRRAVRIFPAHTMERPFRRHPYADAMLAERTPGWRGRLAPNRSGGVTLELERLASGHKA